MTVEGAPFICIMGESGIGKTRLAATFEDGLVIDSEGGAGSAFPSERIIRNASLDVITTLVKKIGASKYDPETRRVMYVSERQGKTIPIGAVVIDTIDAIQDVMKYQILGSRTAMEQRDWGNLLDRLYPLIMALNSLPVPKILCSQVKIIDPADGNLGRRTFSAQGALANKMPRWFDIILHIIVDMKGNRNAYSQPAILDKYQITAKDRHGVLVDLGNPFAVKATNGYPEKDFAKKVMSQFNY